MAKNNNKIFIIGFMGSDRNALGKDTAQKLGLKLIYIDTEIENRDGRSVQRICMTMGEHEYRNQEYEILKELTDSDESFVAVCGDGVIFDDMSADLLKSQTVLVADADLNVDELWQKAKTDKSIPYAFLRLGNEDEKYKKFCEIHRSRRHLYDQFL